MSLAQAQRRLSDYHGEIAGGTNSIQEKQNYYLAALDSGRLTKIDVICALARESFGRKEVASAREFSVYWRTPEGEVPAVALEKAVFLAERLPRSFPKLWEKLEGHKVFSQAQKLAEQRISAANVGGYDDDGDDPNDVPELTLVSNIGEVSEPSDDEPEVRVHSGRPPEIVEPAAL